MREGGGGGRPSLLDSAMGHQSSDSALTLDFGCCAGLRQMSSESASSLSGQCARAGPDGT